jgi:hypothetical protein
MMMHLLFFFLKTGKRIACYIKKKVRASEG